MREFEGYLFRRMAVLTFWSLVSATLLVLTTQVLLRLNILTSSEQALLAFGKITIFLIPSVLSIVAPFALLIGITQVLNGMNSDSELVVMESAGAGPWVVLRPILALSVLISAFTFASANMLEPRANRAFGDTIAEASADLLSLAVRKGSFQRLSEGLYVHIDQMYPGGDFGGIFLSDRRGENNDVVYFAKRGRVLQVGEERFLVLADGEAQQRDTQSGKISIVTFDSYALDLSSFLPSTNDRKTFRPREQSTLYLLNPPEDDYFKNQHPGEISKEPGPAPWVRGRLLANPDGYHLFDSLAVDSAGNVCAGSIPGNITVISPDGRTCEDVAMPDPFPTNICFGGADLRTAYITLSGAGKLVAMDWPRPGTPLHFLN